MRISGFCRTFGIRLNVQNYQVSVYFNNNLSFSKKSVIRFEKSRDKEIRIVYLRAELTVLELLAELLSGLVTSVLLVTFLAVFLGIFSVVFLFSAGFLQASTIIYPPLFANYELSLKLYQRVCFWIYFMRSESVCPTWNSLSCVPQK